MKKYLFVVICAFLFCSISTMTGGEGGGFQNLSPMEIRDIPVNCDDSMADPEAVKAIYGFGSRGGNKLVEHGDCITLLENYKGIETPHLNWAAPYAAGPVKVLYICFQRNSLRDPIELGQRSGFQIDVLQIPGVISDGEADNSPVLHEFFDKKFQKQLAKDHDVIVIPTSDLFWQGGQGVKILDKVIASVKDKVKNGCGLIIRHNAGQWWRIEKNRLEIINEMAPLTQANGRVDGIPERSQAASPITDSFSMSLWPTMSVGGAKTDDGAQTLASVKTNPIMASGSYGKGRVVSFNYSLVEDSGLFPQIDSEKNPLFGDFYEPIYALYLKSIAWAAGKEPRIGLTVPEITECKAGTKPEMKVILSSQGKNTSASVNLKYRLMDSFGNQIAENSQVVKVAENPLEVIPELPVCYANGLYKLYLWLESDGKIENWGAAAMKISGGDEFAAVPQFAGTNTDNIRNFKIKTAGSDQQIEVIGLDDLDRVFFRKTSSCKNDDLVPVDLKNAETSRNQIFFTLLSKDGQITGRQATILYKQSIGLDSIDQNFVIATYGSTFSDPHLSKYMGAVYRAAGFNTVYDNWHSREYVRARATDKGLYSITGSFAPVMKQTEFSKTFKVCPKDPDVQSKWSEELKKAVDEIQTYGGISRVINDENHFAMVTYKDGEIQGAQACQCQYCMAKFRQAMKEKYRDISKLNEVWDTNFKDFDSVSVIEEEMIKGKDNPSGWLEFRQYMNWTYANQYYKWINDQHRPLGKSYNAGVGAPHWTRAEGGPTYAGGDYTYLKKVMPFLMAYGGSESIIFDKSFVGQPGGQKYDPPLEWKQRGSWYHLFNGADALWYYYGSAMIGSEMSFKRQAVWTQEGVKDIVDGIGILVSKAEPQNRQVRMFYSPENLAMAWLFGKRQDAFNALALEKGIPVSENTFRKLFRDFNFIQPSYITADDIRNGDLSDCKLLILNQAFNIDDDTAAAIKQYVKKGGNIIADVMPGTRTQMGKPRTQSIFSDLFGVDASKAAPHKENKVWYSVGICMDAKTQNLFTVDGIWLPGNFSFLDVKGTDAKAQGKVLSQEGKESDACFVNNFGKGKTLLLNFIYRDLNLETSGWHLMFSGALMKWCGIVPPGKIVNPLTKKQLPSHPLYSFKFGKAELLGAIRGELVWSGEGQILIDEARSLGFENDAELAWTGKKHAYNVRSREYLGSAESVKIDLPSCTGKLIALLPYKVTNIEASIPAKAKPGETVKISGKIKTDSEKAGEHVLRMEVYSPTSYKDIHYCQTRIAPAGDSAEFNIPFAYNDREGEWQIIIRDVMTGVENKGKISLKN